MLTGGWLDRLSFRWWLPVATMVLVVSGCQPETAQSPNDPTNPWLSSVPKDSPFLIANQKPLEDTEFDRLLTTIQPLVDVFVDQLRPSDQDFMASAIFPSNGAENWRQAGLDPNGFWAIYVHNKQAIARIPLADEEAFWSTWQRAGGPVPSQQEQPSVTTRGQDMEGPHQQVAVGAGSFGQPWPALLGFPASGWLVLETHNRWLSVSWQETHPKELAQKMPVGAEPTPVSDQKPITEYWSDHAWMTFNQAHGLDGKIGGYINISELMGQHVQSEPECHEAWNTMSHQMPLVVIGSQTLDHHEMTLLTRVLPINAGAGISKTSESAPNIDISQARLAKVAGLGLAIDVAKSRQMLIKQLQLGQEVAQDCPGLEPIKQSRRWAQGLANRPLPPILTSIQGLMTRFDGFGVDSEAMPADQTKQQTARFFTEVHLQNPQFLIGLAGLFSPELAAIDLRANRPPQPLPSNLVDALGGVPVYLSTTNSSIRASSDGQPNELSNTRDEQDALPWVSGTLNLQRLNELSDVMGRWPMGPQNQLRLAEVVQWGALAGIEQLQWLIQPNQDGLDIVISTQHSLESLPALLEQ